MEAKLYNNTIIVKRDKRHVYTCDGVYIPGVTTITNTIHKPGLVYWSANEAVAFIDRHIKPGVAYDELELAEIKEGARTAHTQKKKKAADKGTIVHGWIHKYITALIDGLPIPEFPVNPEVKEACVRLIEWMDAAKVVPLESEKIVFHKDYWYAGQLDVKARCDGKLGIIDFKTGSGIWNEYRYQTAAYLYADQRECGIAYAKRYIVRIGSEGEFELMELDEHQEDFKAFLGALEIFKRERELKQQAKTEVNIQS